MSSYGRFPDCRSNASLLPRVPPGSIESSLGEKTELEEKGFGAEVRTALAQRTERLVDCGLASRRQGQVTFARDLLDTLTRRELADTAAQFARQTGLAYRPVEEGDHLSGIYRRRVDLASGRFALIEDGQQFFSCPDVRSLTDSSDARCHVFCAAAASPGTWGGNASLESDLVAGSNVDRQIAHDRSRSKQLSSPGGLYGRSPLSSGNTVCAPAGTLGARSGR
jgi:Protein of unknown function (DUF3363)